MKIKPLGFYVLVEVDVVEKTTASGIIIGDVTRDQEACEFGIVKELGPTAYAGFPGCEEKGAEAWGVKVGDRVEYRRYEGKLSNHPDMENHRYIPDSHIIGVIND